MRLFPYIVPTTSGARVSVLATNIVEAHRKVRASGLEPVSGTRRAA